MPTPRYVQMLIMAAYGIATGRARARADVLTSDDFADGRAMKKHLARVRVLERDRRHPMGLFDPERLSQMRFTTQRPDETRAGKKKMGIPARPPAGFSAIPGKSGAPTRRWTRGNRHQDGRNRRQTDDAGPARIDPDGCGTEFVAEVAGLQSLSGGRDLNSDEFSCQFRSPASLALQTKSCTRIRGVRPC
jgi:hypothetical protein